MKRSASFVLLVLVLAACESGSPSHSGKGPVVGMDVRRSSTAAGTVAAVADQGSAEVEAPGSQAPSGPPAAVVPDVRGMAFEAAVHRLWRAGIRFRLVYGQASDAPLWSVIQENPTPGSDTPESAAVNLVISMHHELGVGVTTTVRCKPEAQELADPYCLGKLLKYTGS